jgi:hypothetical protein
MTVRGMLDIAISVRAGATVVTPTGILDVASAPHLRDVLLKCIADQPHAVIVELDHLELRKAYTLSVFTVVARRTADWSGVPVILVSSANGGSRLQLHTRAIARFLPVYADLPTALAAAGRPPPRRVTRLRLAPHNASAATARQLAITTCEFWGCPELAGDAAAVATELVANGVEHAGTDTELRLELRRGLLTVAPRLRPPADRLRTAGFGLQIVESLSTAWGWAPRSDGGKVVWAVLRSWPVRHPGRPGNGE